MDRRDMKMDLFTHQAYPFLRSNWRCPSDPREKRTYFCVPMRMGWDEGTVQASVDGGRERTRFCERVRSG
ncbi:hypothetical protein Rmet_6771 (plasmid) [Cupriavidus metallidurans CH34]|uniref:Uncharacterized protein n=1 Tax=Cupriavidus metallidurans (strain ATCC 43123 / DSM 2839 / NBRC 102507 / CH34) TaxID=266264 RepID=D3DYH8_CUPMC|nr:hypothetical protein Rmet_6771 [Cupriavidus metallidurans CH34]